MISKITYSETSHLGCMMNTDHCTLGRLVSQMTRLHIALLNYHWDSPDEYKYLLQVVYSTFYSASKHIQIVAHNHHTTQYRHHDELRVQSPALSREQPQVCGKVRSASHNGAAARQWSRKRRGGHHLFVASLPTSPLHRKHRIKGKIHANDHSLPVTCLDPRVVPEQFFGPELNSPVIRNAAGRVNKDVINSITLLRSLANPSAVIVIHHTGKRTLFFLPAAWT